MHEGHRDRVYTRYLDGDEFTEEQLAELLLFYAIPVKDVTPLAKRLLKKFGTVQEIINAPTEELLRVQGVGKKTASFFKAIKQLTDNLGEKPEAAPSISVQAVVEKFRSIFDGIATEQFAAIMLGKNGEELKREVYTDLDRTEVNVNVQELMAEISRVKLHSVIVAHNHLSGNVKPSLADDLTTKRLAIMLNAQGVSFYDHLIFCGDSYYSYHISGKLSEIKNAARAAML